MLQSVREVRGLVWDLGVLRTIVLCKFIMVHQREDAYIPWLRRVIEDNCLGSSGLENVYRAFSTARDKDLEVPPLE